jgi:tetratricopeptide (TPR) repeat protein
MLQAPLQLGSSATQAADAEAHASWLYNLVCLALYSTGGGAGLVIAKALVFAALAVVLLQLSRQGSGYWIAAVCTGVALLTMSIRLPLQPVILSYLFLGLTLWFLRPTLVEDNETESSGPFAKALGLRSWLPPWPLLVLFVIWVQVDSWFVLGLATVALVWLGRLVDLARQAVQAVKDLSSLRPLLGRVLAALAVLVAACLLNPSHVHAFRLPWESTLNASALLTPEVMSPFQRAYFETDSLGRTPAGLAYFPLLGLGLLSFLLNQHHWKAQRFLPWIGLALFSAFQIRAVPFFAILGGPVLAWNLQEYFARRAEAERQEDPLWRPSLIVLRVVTLLLGLAFLVSAWPGWLQAQPCGWRVEPGPSLVRGAKAVKVWYKEGKLGSQTRGLHLSPQSAFVFAWFCPEDKGRLEEELASVFLGNPDAPRDWDQRMRSAGINHIVVYDPQRGRLVSTLNRFLADPEQWPLLLQEGDLVIFGWRDPRAVLPGAGGAASGRNQDKGDPFRGLELDLTKLAFKPDPAKRAPRQSTEPIDEDKLGLVGRLKNSFWKSSRATQEEKQLARLDRDEAKLHLLHAEALKRTAALGHLAVWEDSQAAAFVGAASNWSTWPTWTFPFSSMDALLRRELFRPTPVGEGPNGPVFSRLSQSVFWWQGRFTWQRDDTSPALLYLAIRAARRALAVNPNDAQAYQALGSSYVALIRDTRERAWGEKLPDLITLRHAQASAALNQAIALQPNLAKAHLDLAWLYEHMGYLDLTLKHLQAHRQLARKAPPPEGLSAEQVRQIEAAYDERLEGLAKLVEEREQAFEDETGRFRVLDRAIQALQKGLAQKALDVLLESTIAMFGGTGMAMELALLGKVGRAKEVLQWTDPEQEADLGASSYHWVRVQALAALGDYALAQEEFDELIKSDDVDEGRFRFSPRQAMGALVTQALMDEPSLGPNLPARLWRTLTNVQYYARMGSLAKRLQHQGDMVVLQGLLALEEGDVETAEVKFHQALDIWKDEAGATTSGGVDFNARPIAQQCLEWLK